jgi:hypothetical protein
VNGHRTPISIAIRPWLHDHSVGGKTVLPAVETMLILAAHCAAGRPHIDVRIMEDVRFGKFLEIPQTAGEIAAQVECIACGDGGVRVKLLSHVQFKAMARIKEHGEITFSPSSADNQTPKAVDPRPCINPTYEIPAERLYREMVPFGPYYQTLQGILRLSDRQAWGELQAPELPFTDPVQNLLGSPFPLDGALHAACALGQQHVGFIPFPVGFQRRRVILPTQPGGRYRTMVTMTSPPGDELVFDLAIFDDAGQLYETVTGVRMRDVGMALTKQNPRIEAPTSRNNDLALR